MSIRKKESGFRRKRMWGFGSEHTIGSDKIGQLTVPKKSEIKRVLISRPNHRLGNTLLITPIVQEVAKIFPECKIDLFVKGGLAPAIFRNYTNVDRIIELPKRPFKNIIGYIRGWILLLTFRYDIAINVVPDSSSGKLSVLFSNSKLKIVNYKKPVEHMAKYPVYHLRDFLSNLGFQVVNEPVAHLDLRLSRFEIIGGRTLLKNVVKNDDLTICLYTYATGKKCLSRQWWETFYYRLMERYPDYNIIEVLPLQNVSQLEFKVPAFYSTNIREMAALIANTQVFISADGGAMHLASAVNTPTVGIFSVTDKRIYEPYNMKSEALNINDTNVDSCLAAVDNILGRFDDRSRSLNARVL